jgi:hypothetical protein
VLRSPGSIDPPAPSGVFLERRCGRGGFREDVGEAAVGHGGADVGGVARPIEEMGVDVEGDRCAWPSMRLTWQTSRRRSTMRWLAKVWRRSWRRSGGRSRPSRRLRLTAWARAVRATFSLPERSARPGCEDVVVSAGEIGAASFPGEDGGEKGRAGCRGRRRASWVRPAGRGLPGAPARVGRGRGRRRLQSQPRPR